MFIDISCCNDSHISLIHHQYNLLASDHHHCCHLDFHCHYLPLHMVFTTYSIMKCINDMPPITPKNTIEPYHYGVAVAHWFYKPQGMDQSNAISSQGVSSQSHLTIISATFIITNFVTILVLCAESKHSSMIGEGTPPMLIFRPQVIILIFASCSVWE